MHKSQIYIQCKLTKPTYVGGENDPLAQDTLITWLPERLAFNNKYIKIFQEDGTWDYGWRVREVFYSKHAASIADEHVINRSKGACLPYEGCHGEGWTWDPTDSGSGWQIYCDCEAGIKLKEENNKVLDELAEEAQKLKLDY